MAPGVLEHGLTSEVFADIESNPEYRKMLRAVRKRLVGPYHELYHLPDADAFRAAFGAAREAAAGADPNAWLAS